jgi:hypothetical protein
MVLFYLLYTLNQPKALTLQPNTNPIQAVQDWQDWTYAGGSLKQHKEGQDTGLSAYHPHLQNVPHYLEPQKA